MSKANEDLEYMIHSDFTKMIKENLIGVDPGFMEGGGAEPLSKSHWSLKAVPRNARPGRPKSRLRVGVTSSEKKPKFHVIAISLNLKPL